VDVGTLARGLALNRTLFGAGFLLSPRSARTWIGPFAGTPGGRILTMALGARDLALGLGALAALGRGRPARAWFAGHLVADATDVVATWRERRELHPASAAYALAVAGAATAIAAAYVLAGEASAPADAAPAPGGAA
jgi:hypothetical protein